MQSFWHPSLRVRILAPAALVAIPAIAMLLYISFEHVADTGTMYGTLVAFALIAVVIMVGVHLAADRLLMRPIAQLTTASRRLAAGDLGARVAASTTIPELNELAK